MIEEYLNPRYMIKAIELAKKGNGWVNPNPMVGAVIVKEDRIISSGYHHEFGDIHAEVDAINNSKESLSGCSIYVTLEPCCHYGKRPPCTEAIIKSGIRRVVIGSRDPNPLVSGKGVEILKNNGIEIIEDFLKEECDEINTVFFNYFKNKKPYVVMKFGMTLDGKISTNIGDSKWITSDDSRKNVHRDRHKFMSIMVGINTVLQDDPMLDCRIDGMKNPIRIICDSNLRIPYESRIVKTAKVIKTIIATKSNDNIKINKLKEYGCIVIVQDSDVGNTYKMDARINLKRLMNDLYEMGIDSIYLEGGSELNWSALEAGIVDEVHTYVSPKIFGGGKSKSPIGGLGIDKIQNCKRLEFKSIEKIGEDILIVSNVNNFYY